MQRHSIVSLLRNAIGHHEGWERAWRSPALKPEYDVVIVGAGGHGLATAYFLAKDHGITNVAVIERSWLGGGTMGRNTSTIRSNDIRDVSIKFNDAWSSRRGNRSGAPDGILTPQASDLALGPGAETRAAASGALFADVLATETVDDSRRANTTNAPFSIRRFRAQIEAMLGRRLEPPPIGRPRKTRGA